jgi:hypothetical protein
LYCICFVLFDFVLFSLTSSSNKQLVCARAKITKTNATRVHWHVPLCNRYNPSTPFWTPACARISTICCNGCSHWTRSWNEPIEKKSLAWFEETIATTRVGTCTYGLIIKTRFLVYIFVNFSAWRVVLESEKTKLHDQPSTDVRYNILWSSTLNEEFARYLHRPEMNFSFAGIDHITIVNKFEHWE